MRELGKRREERRDGGGKEGAVERRGAGQEVPESWGSPESSERTRTGEKETLACGMFGERREPGKRACGDSREVLAKLSSPPN